MQNSLSNASPKKPTTVLNVQNLRFSWPKQIEECLLIDKLHVQSSESIFLYGPSGCGKSTLLSLLAGVLKPQDGHIFLAGQNLSTMRASKRDHFRAEHIGYIFQQFNLLPYLSLVDNVLMPCRFSTRRSQVAIKLHGNLVTAAKDWLREMKLPETSWHRPARTLSVGQQQRVAAARALIGAPSVVIADEPTSALDEDMRDVFMHLLLKACEQADSTLLLVSHDQRLASRFSRAIALPDINYANSKIHL